MKAVSTMLTGMQIESGIARAEFLVGMAVKSGGVRHWRGKSSVAVTSPSTRRPRPVRRMCRFPDTSRFGQKAYLLHPSSSP